MTERRSSTQYVQETRPQETRLKPASVRQGGSTQRQLGHAHGGRQAHLLSCDGALPDAVVRANLAIRKAQEIAGAHWASGPSVMNLVTHAAMENMNICSCRPGAKHRVMNATGATPTAPLPKAIGARSSQRTHMLFAFCSRVLRG